MINKNVENKNTQDFKPHYHDASLPRVEEIWLEKKNIFKENQNLLRCPSFILKTLTI